MYLDYAEAYFEYNGTLEGDALTYFNLIRQRAGIPNVEVPTRTSVRRQLREVIHRRKNHRADVEGHMSYDYRRWLIALKEWSGMENGMIGLNSYGTTNEEYYKNARLDAQPFIFRDEQYLSPIKQDYLNVNSNLVQNPGW